MNYISRHFHQALWLNWSYLLIRSSVTSKHIWNINKLKNERNACKKSLKRDYLQKYNYLNFFRMVFRIIFRYLWRFYILQNRGVSEENPVPASLREPISASDLIKCHSKRLYALDSCQTLFNQFNWQTLSSTNEYILTSLFFTK